MLFTKGGRMKDEPAENVTINGLEFLKFIKRLEDANIDIHLIPIKTRKKTPDVLTNWNTVRITPESAFARVNELHSNVGCVAHSKNETTGKCGLCFLDIDLIDGKFPMPKEKLDELLKIGTLATKTKSGGIQLIFRNVGITEYLIGRGFSTNPRYSIEGSSQECGELRTNVAYVLTPGSFCPIDYESGKKGSISGATGLYSVFNDDPILDLTPENLPKFIIISHEKFTGGKPTDTKLQEEFIGKSKEDIDTRIGFDPKSIHQLREGEEIVNEKGLNLNEVIEKDKEFAEILMVVGEKGTRSEKDWFVARRMRAMGFTANQVATALITFRYYQKTPGASPYDYVRYISLTIRNAFTREITTYDPHQSWYANVNVTDISKTAKNELPEELPDKKYVLVQAPPRTGKTRWGVLQLIKAKTGVYITNKHEIIRHALHIFETLEKKKTAVYLVGKERACNRLLNRGECGECPLRPRIHPGFDDDGHLRADVLTVGQLRRTATELLLRHRILTPEILMENENVCPYYTLLLAEYESDYCFTIPYFLTSNREIKRIKRTNRDLLVIDEDPVVTSFYPQEYEIATYTYGRGNKNFNNTLGSVMDIIIDIETKINEQKRKKQADKEILRLCGILHEINEKIEDVVDHTTIDKKKEFDQWVKKFDVSNDYDKIMKDEIIERLKKFEQDLKEEEHEIELFPIFAPLLHVADKSFVWIGSSPSKTLYFIPDRHVMYAPPDSYKKVLFIGATQAELYIQDICEDAKDSEIITIENFKYANNFVLITLKGATRKEETRMLYSLLFKYAQENAASNFISPALILTSSKKKQQKLENMLKSKCVASTDQSEEEQVILWLWSNMNIFYSNSTLSRGLDIPQYSTLFVESVKFAIPYFTALMEHAQETGNLQMTKRAKAIISKITVDEITNSTLRHSPTVDDPAESFKKEDRVKIIVVRDRDVSNILTSVRAGMYEMEVNGMENLDFAVRLLSVLPERFDKTTIPKTLAQNCPEGIVRHYCGTTSRKNVHAISKKSRTNLILKTDLDTVLKSELHTFPKNNAAALVNPKIKTILENHPALKVGKRLGENALINFISVHLNRKKSLNMVEQTMEQNKQNKDNKDFAPLVVDKGRPNRKLESRRIPLESNIKKNIINMVKGELLKEEMDGGNRFYRLFNKVIFGDPKDDKGNPVT
jgi:hypothetical protein